MNMKNVRRIALGSVAGLTLAAGMVWGSMNPLPSASAQVDDASQEQGMFQEMRGGKGRFGGQGRGGERSAGDMLLANALGVTPVALQEAEQSARNATIDQAAAAGVITAEQAAQIKDGQRPTGDVSGLRTYMADTDKDAALATALGITPEALAAAKDSRVQKGVEAGLITQEQGNQILLREKIQEATKAAVEQAIDEAVTEGLITQEEANAMKARDFGKMHNHDGGRRGGNGFGGGRQGGQGGLRGFFGGNGFGGGLFGGSDAPAPQNPTLNDA